MTYLELYLLVMPVIGVILAGVKMLVEQIIRR